MHSLVLHIHRALRTVGSEIAIDGMGYGRVYDKYYGREEVLRLRIWLMRSREYFVSEIIVASREDRRVE